MHAAISSSLLADKSTSPSVKTASKVLPRQHENCCPAEDENCSGRFPSVLVDTEGKAAALLDKCLIRGGHFLVAFRLFLYW
jgi:hypothetical protein